MERRRNDTEIIVLRQEVATLKVALEQLTAQVKELLEAWNTASGLLKFMKVMSVIAGGVVAAWMGLKGVK